MKKTGFYPEALKDIKWDDTEIQPIVEVDDKGSCDVCEEGEEDFWSVYVHNVEGGAVCIADVPTKEDAEKLEELINLIK